MDDPVKKENMAAEMLRAADVIEEAGAPELVVRGNRAIGNYIAELEAKNAELREEVEHWKRRADAEDRKRWAVLPEDSEDGGETWREKYERLARDYRINELGWVAVEDASAAEQYEGGLRLDALIEGGAMEGKSDDY